ncbi:alpha/beta-hydrolase [Setomelanomma holmii]|uniref:Alpha/beta-hydrolase n=1 Tax=Setomelanomma holmii TaxID=210430 RepID=A0A9P4LPW1_9PLEO|nr:alpha/beta-hydrolase [Setomelanomma holmii]
MSFQTPDNPVPASAQAAPNHGSIARRPALPTGKTSESRQKRTPKPNQITTQAASPAVISSLIDQLSAISIPAHDHFENLLAGYNNGLSASAHTSIHTLSGRNSLAGHDGSSIEPSAYNNSIRDLNDIYPDDACEAPVIRTAKPPSGFSPLTAPKKHGKPHSLSSYIGRNSGSSASLHSTHSNPSVASFGNISIEAAPQPSGGSERSSVESKRSAKGHRSLMYMGSRERLRLKETERKRHTTHSLEDIAMRDSPRKNSVPVFSYEDTIKEEPTSREENRPFQGESSRFVQRYPERSGSPRRLRINLVDGSNRESPSDQGLIPERGSSLKHTGSPPRKSKKHRTSTSSRMEPHKAEAAAEEDVNKHDSKMDDEAVMKEKILHELEQEENEVAQRIRELREQKLRRDKLAGKQPDSTKAHKVLGITGDVPALERPVERTAEKVEVREPETEPMVVPQTRALRHSRHRSLTVNDGDDLTPFPINYAVAMQRMEELSPPTPTFPPPRSKSPPPPSISVASSRETGSSVTSPRRSSSAAVGGRSAVARKATASSIMGTTKGHKHSSSVTDSAVSLKPVPFRSASEEINTRHQSMIVPSPASNSLALQRRRTLTKKRWSHPDLPAEAEKAHNDKVDKAEAAVTEARAVQKPPHPVIEERPASMDSIDLEVDGYLNSSRLSQKIRHPQTGRIISFSEVGDPTGFAVFVCVGMGLTRYVMAFYDQLAATLKLRLITPDRPGIGGSQADPNGTPLSWPDDVLVICQALKITKFSMLAHSAGAVYALATSLRMPQHIRGRVHLLAPWIPPSQMAPIGVSQDSPPTQQLPRSQRFLRALPPSLLKVANSTFLSATSASLQRTGPKNSPKTRRKSIHPQPVSAPDPRPSLKDHRRESMLLMDQVLPNASSLTLSATSPSDPNYEKEQRMKEELTKAERERQHAFDERLTFAIWDRATTNANPATDLIVCLETKQTIGFRYEDINRPVVIHHGSKDSRVPVDNVRWLGKLMRKCEVRILEGEQHGLMASAQVMGNVLMEMASDWEDWTAVVQGKGDHRSLSRKRTAERLRTTISRDDLRLSTR